MIKLFEDFNQRNTEIDAICKEYKIINYTINVDGSIDVTGNVFLLKKNLTVLPLKFGRVSGTFDCDNNKLLSLEGSPSYVGHYFSCRYNDLTTLEGAPSYIGGSFVCSNNKLTSLEGSPSYVGDTFYCGYNDLKTLKGAPKDISFFYCSENPLPITIYENEIDIKYILANQDDYGIWNKYNSFNAARFDIMMKDKDL